jgi:hypothetical protein
VRNTRRLPPTTSCFSQSRNGTTARISDAPKFRARPAPSTPAEHNLNPR